VAAVLGHRAELGLDEEQVARLQSIDDDLQERQAARAARPPAKASTGSDGPPAGAPPAPRPGAAEDAGAGGMGRHRGGHRGTPGGPDGGRGTAGPQRTWDDEDTAAYLRAEQILRPDQRDRAREIAEQYREELYDERAARKP
jgi:hypothetical protein